MSEPSLNAERIAAFLDGRLSAEERAVVLSQLAADPEWREIAVDAAAVRDAVEDADGVAGTRPITVSSDLRADAGDRAEGRRISRTSTSRRWAPWAALAAAACVTVFVVLTRDGPPAITANVAPVAPVQALAMTVAAEDASELTRERWRVVRAGTGTLDETTRAVRLGVLSVDALLDRDGQGEEARAEMVELLQPLNAAVARRLISEARDSASFVVAFGAARELVSQDAYDVGVWLELLRAGSESARAAPGMNERLLRVVEAKQLSPERAAELTVLVRRLEGLLRSSEGGQMRETVTAVLGALAS